ncbi:MAG: hypothetical protein LAT64_10080 [Phycisphaerales bacterium]|nr:hypothetical protein [Planctomycetota bacterium]MCH8509098.1 hypothetical protein [Phycisphaerales bacterium]
MTRFVVCLMVLFVAAPAWGDLSQSALAQPGAYEAGFRTVTVTRGNGSTFTARLFYPAVSAGEDAPVDASGGPYPGVSFGHGFFQPVGNYQSTLLHLATHGYLVIATNSQGGLFPNHSAFAADILDCLTWLEQQHALAGSDLEGLVDTQAFGLSGHSMGGGAAILAAASLDASDTRVRAIAPLAAANTNPSSIAASSNFFVPVRHIVGSQDTIVTPGTTVQMYNNSARAKQFVNLQGGFHCGFVDGQGFGCDSGAMSRADQLAYIRALLTEFFDLYLKGDQARWRGVWLDAAQDDPRAVYTSAPDSTLAASAGSVTVRTGARRTVDITVTNLGPGEASFEVVAEDAPWAMGPVIVGPLAPGAEGTVSLVIEPPLSEPAGSFTLLVSARSLRDGGTRSAAEVGVTVLCGADFNADGGVDFFDIQDFLQAYLGQDPAADFTGDGSFDFFDVQAFLAAFAAGCAE